jgi:hypothetical protein
MANEETQFEAAVNRILDDIEQQELGSIERTMKLLDQVRREVVARIAENGSSAFTTSVYKQVEKGIDQAIASFKEQLQMELNSDVDKMAELGAELIDEPMKAIIGNAPVVAVSKEVAQVAASYLPGMIEGLASELRSKVAGVLQRTVLGAISIQEAIDQVGRNLTDTGIFKTVAARAETIVRTEVLRIQSIASYARMKAAEKQITEFGWTMTREWTTARDGRVRLAHQIAQGQQRSVAEDFLVGGEKLRYPRDPKGSAANTIN